LVFESAFKFAKIHSKDNGLVVHAVVREWFIGTDAISGMRDPKGTPRKPFNFIFVTLAA
jgi:hypothetical protein